MQRAGSYSSSFWIWPEPKFYWFEGYWVLLSRGGGILERSPGGGDLILLLGGLLGRDLPRGRDRFHSNTLLSSAFFGHLGSCREASDVALLTRGTKKKSWPIINPWWATQRASHEARPVLHPYLGCLHQAGWLSYFCLHVSNISQWLPHSPTQNGDISIIRRKTKINTQQ